MLTADRIADIVEEYRRRVDGLYKDVRVWIGSRWPDTVFTDSEMQLEEELPGLYEVVSLEATPPGLPSVRFLPRGMFMVGARGRVHVKSRLGREELVWVDDSRYGREIGGNGDTEDEILIGRPVFKNIGQGWAWSDIQGRGLVSLTESIFLDRIFMPLTR